MSSKRRKAASRRPIARGGERTRAPRVGPTVVIALLLTTGAAAVDLPIPSASDWVDYGTILEAGALGDWDFQLFGGFAASAVKKEGTYYLYYQGASGYRIVDDTVTFRAIGVATSPDGINFSKHVGNPVIVWLPNNNGEEGAASSAAALDPAGEIVLYYGANTMQSPVTVNADGRIAVSPDGLDFTDEGIVLDHTDPAVWGFGDELYPVAAFEESGQWFVYYIPNGSPQGRTLGVGWGPLRDQLTQTAPALSGGASIQAFGTGGAAKIGDDSYALFLNNVLSSKMEVRTVSPSTPDQLSAPVATYAFGGFRQGTVLLDQDTNTWFMYYRDSSQSRYAVKLAPVGAPDTTPPTAPSGLTANPVAHDRVDLSWNPASDAETGIVQYKVFRDGGLVETVKGWSFSDSGLSELSDYTYEVSAINYHGVEGPKSSPVQASTPADVTPPDLASVSASGSATAVTVVFDEPVEQASAENVANYGLSGGVQLLSAVLALDLETVTLTTTAQAEHTTYELTVGQVEDRAQTPNGITPPIKRRYLFSAAPGLVGSWRLDEASGTTAPDTSNFAHEGSLDYPGEEPATWTVGRRGGALEFDGLNDLVLISADAGLAAATDGSHTFTAWAKAQDVPPNTQGNNSDYSILTRSYTGLYYDFNQRFKATFGTAAGSQLSLVSGAFAAGDWHHVAMVVDDPLKELRLYVDGQEVSGSPMSYSGSPAGHGAADYLIGASDPLVERWDFRFKGALDEARVYDRALDVSEIQSLAGVPIQHTLTVSKTGTGSGTVTSSPLGIACGVDCLESHAQGTLIDLFASPGFGSSFGGWSGAADCSDGSVTMTTDLACTADFTQTCTPDVVLTSQTVSATQIFEACSSITAGPDFRVVTPGDVTFRTLDRVVLRNGFSVGRGARFAIDLDP